jgi:hypothetical protein
VTALKALLELLALAPLEKVIELLGDHADSPSFEQLASAIDELEHQGFTRDDVVSLLAYAIGDSFPAAAHCRQLFIDREELALPELPEIVVSASVLAAPREVNPEIREQRKHRREEEKKRKKATQATRAPKTPRPKGQAPERVDARVTLPLDVLETRRRLLLTPREQGRFDDDHVLVGAVVVLTVPFDAKDALQPDLTAKERPVLVVAASESEVLVRAIYSNPSPTRSIFAPWRRVGLDHVSYIDDVRVSIPLDDVPLRPMAQLTIPEWNSLT